MQDRAAPDQKIDIVALGEPMVEFNETAAAQYRQGYGGDTANFAVAAARQGARVAYSTRLGDDKFGRMFMALWEKEGIDTSSVQIDTHAHTGVYFVSHDEQGHHFDYLRAGSAASRMTPAFLDKKMLQSASYLHVSGISQAISESACETVFAAIEIARAAGAVVSYDPNLRLRLWALDQAKATIEKTIPLADVFLPSLDEAQTLSGVEDIPSVLAWCASHGATKVVLKCGAQGAWVWEKKEEKARHVPAFRVEPVDATGAGDCFDGALIARLAAGDSLLDATRYANVAAAISTTGYGAVAPIPDQGRVLVHIVETLLVE
ncbi:sugar kinase [Undibacterium terreum]|uniref:Fructokinase-like protein n=1 Tax=Undibacterium terreum TaxID=1224302 RepID=A0A916UCX0_9BURK|nr:sugar kinase [Undibacterium terreum]GGC69047.1 fructokinase-like protein [Undibacterium terreum]